MNADIMPLQFDGDTVLITQRDGRVWVILKRLCEALGLDFSSQVAKLREKPWATMALITTVAEDGKDREMLALDLDSVPMWLVTIDPARVAEPLRPKLVRYQRYLKQVISDHVFGRAPKVAVSQFSKAKGYVQELVEAGLATKGQALAMLALVMKQELGCDFSSVLEAESPPAVPPAPVRLLGEGKKTYDISSFPFTAATAGGKLRHLFDQHRELMNKLGRARKVKGHRDLRLHLASYAEPFASVMRTAGLHPSPLETAGYLPTAEQVEESRKYALATPVEKSTVRFGKQNDRVRYEVTFNQAAIDLVRETLQAANRVLEQQLQSILKTEGGT